MKCNICNKKESRDGRKICNTCKSRIYISKNRPLMVWHWIKRSAKKRGIEFDLNKVEFIDLIKNEGYIEGSGRLRNSLTIDRINGNLGYFMGNIQVIKKIDNINKFHNKYEEYPF